MALEPTRDGNLGPVTERERETRSDRVSVACSCDEAVQNRWRMERDYPNAVAPTFPPNDDGEVVCAFCWEVLGHA